MLISINLNTYESNKSFYELFRLFDLINPKIERFRTDRNVCSAKIRLMEAHSEHLTIFLRVVYFALFILINILTLNIRS